MRELEIIGLSGKAETGKSYIAEHFLSPHGYREVAFGDPGKLLLYGMGLATYEELFVTKPPHVRTLMQRELTRYREEYDYDIWCKVLWGQMERNARSFGITRYVIADVRFPNEAEYVKRAGGKLLRIHAPERVEASSLDEAQRADISETALDRWVGFDWIIHNNPSESPTVAYQVMNFLTAHNLQHPALAL